MIGTYLRYISEHHGIEDSSGEALRMHEAQIYHFTEQSHYTALPLVRTWKSGNLWPRIAEFVYLWLVMT